MTKLSGCFGFVLAFGVAGSVSATQPPDPNPSSDGSGNTAYGSGVLPNIKGANSGAIANQGILPDSVRPAAYDGAVFNTGVGVNALNADTYGQYNAAVGYLALFANTTGNQNAAMGAGALYANTSGSYNTAIGQNALEQNTTASDNTASGFSALNSNTTGYANTATGFQANYSNTTGYYNTATGYNALYSNTSGFYNTATGFQALYLNTTGQKNFADGVNALYSNTSGGYNTGFGVNALGSNTTGSYNIGEGYHGGYNLTSGSYNIDIGNVGVAAESGTTRIGTEGTQKTVYIAGLLGNAITGSTVVINSSGQLGVLSSSERYKTGIARLTSETDKLARLRPVTFHLKSEPAGPAQYGLIAEEVEKVYPELVIHNARGGVEGVRYDELAPLLLDRVQKQAGQLTQQATQLARQDVQLKQLQQQGAQLRETRQQLAQVQAIVAQLQSERMAMR